MNICSLQHVVDSTAPNIEEHRSTVFHVLNQIGVPEEKLKNMIEVWNKVRFFFIKPSNLKYKEATAIFFTRGIFVRLIMKMKRKTCII